MVAGAPGRKPSSIPACKKGTVTVNGHEGETIPHWLVGAILKQAGLTKEDLKK